MHKSLLDPYTKPVQTFDRQWSPFTGPGKDSTGVSRPRLRPALAREDEQASSSHARLTYSLVTLDGNGLLLEEAREKRRLFEELQEQEARQARSTWHSWIVASSCAGTARTATM